MNDLMDLAEAVGVYEEQERKDVNAAYKFYMRAGQALTATTFGVVIGTALLWSEMVGVLP